MEGIILGNSLAQVVISYDFENFTPSTSAHTNISVHPNPNPNPHH